MKKIILLVLSITMLIAFVQRDKINRLYSVLTMFDEDKIVQNFSQMENNFYHSRISKSSPEQAWDSSTQAFQLPDVYSWNGEDKNVQDWLAMTSTTSLVIVKDGSIVFEDYLQGTQQSDLRISWSMAKSFLSAMFGIAVDEGLIDIQKTVTDYLPEFKDSAYNNVRLLDVLNMASGVAFDEDYLAFNSDINKMGRVLALGGSMDEFAQSLTVQERPAGQNRHYVSIDTHVLSMVLRKVTGLDLQTYFDRRLWSKLGTEGDAVYLTDGDGVAFALGGLNMTSRDYARFGQLFLQKGQWQGESLVPESWVIESTADNAPPPIGKSAFGYGYQWWVPTGSAEQSIGDYTAGGIYGQFIYINPKENVVIVKTSAHRGFRNDGEDGNLIKHETMEMFRAIAKHADDIAK